MLCIQHLKIYGRILVIGMPHISSKYRKSMFRGFPSPLDSFQGIDSEGVAKAVWGRRTKDVIADNMPELIKSAVLYCLVEGRADDLSR